MILEALLTLSEMLTPDELQKAKRQSLYSGLPIGQILLLSQLLSESDLLFALNVLVRLRDDAIFSTDDAVAVMQSYRADRARSADSSEVAPFELKTFREPVSKNGILLGQLFVDANLVEAHVIPLMLELSLIRRALIQPNVKKAGASLRDVLQNEPVILSERGPLIGQVFVEQKLVTPEVLEFALDLQQRVAAGEMSAAEAAGEL
ncbi:MAG: hypothetical protein JST01_25875 [Cyanobacteria bacterium SZAS TMP-1]|nr:hypothetical protein [Cyanobacteria bacterium SZAS TMP-1]